MFKCQNCLRTLPNKEKGNLYRKVLRFTPSNEEGYLNTKEEEEHLDVCKECMKACVGFLDV